MIVIQLLSEGFEDLLESLLTTGKVPLDRLTFLTILDSPRPNLTQRLAQVSLTQSWTSFFSSSTPTILASKKVIWKLIGKLEDPATVVTAFYLLTFVQAEDFDRVAVERLYEAMQTLTNCDSIERNPLVEHWNPLLVCVVASEQCEKISHKNLAFRDMFSRQARIFLDLAVQIQSQYYDYTHLKELYAEKVFGRKCVFDILADNPERYRKLLMDSSVVSIAEELWRGQVRPGFGLDSSCMVSHFLGLVKQPGDVWKVHRLFKLRFKQPSVFQYRFWNRDGFIRYFFETICLLSVYVIMVDTLVNYLKTVEESATGDAVNDEDIFILCYVATLVMYHFQVLALKLFLHYPPSIDIRTFLDFGLLILSVVIEDLQTGGSLVDLSKDQSIYMLELCAGMLYLFAGFRIMVVLLRTRTFGPILRMIYVIWKDVLNYLLIYMLALLSFSMLFTSTLWRVENFSSIQLSVRTLFHWGISGIDLEQISSRPALASTLGIIWTLISAVFMLNLLIAVLSSRYEELAPQAKADFVCIVYQSYHQTRCDSDYGCLVVAPAPFNFLTLPAIPLYLLFPQKAKAINNWFNFISFQVMFLAALVCFSAYCGAMLLAMYALVPILIVRRGGWRRSFMIVPWLLAGPVYMLFLWGLSYRHLYSYVYYQEPTGGDSEKDFYSRLTEHLRRLTERIGSGLVPFDEVIPSLRQFPGSIVSMGTSSSSSGSISQRNSVKSGSSSSGFMQSLAGLQWKKIVKLLSPFASHAQVRNGVKMIDVRRTYRFFKMFGDNPDRLRAANIQYVQKALLRTFEDK